MNGASYQSFAGIAFNASQLIQGIVAQFKPALGGLSVSVSAYAVVAGKVDSDIRTNEYTT